MKIIYVAGALFAENDWAIRCNIHRAAEVGMEVAKLGAYPVIPHTNTGSMFTGTITLAFWYEGTLELLRRCDAMILVPGYEGSKGVQGEIAESRRLNMPLFTGIGLLKTWLAERTKTDG
ncbi:MAG: DUF4406 domain-containing protein [Candidatus Eremiobacteraeota bacterium]|nr:DUF4406 domain-containing protein [Candidatus Eremiobacteraeota bacterium]